MKSVLLVDDDTNVLLTLGTPLRNMGYTVYTAKDAAQAVAVVRKNRPDIAVLDIGIPAGDGFIVAERLHHLIDVAATPLIFMTASSKPGLQEQAHKLGAVAFLTKPFDATLLVNAIESALSAGGSAQTEIRSA